MGGRKPVIMRMVVDLPAPLGPRKPSTSPRSTENETPSTARLVPNTFSQILNLNHTLLTPFLTEMTGADILPGLSCKQFS